MITAGEWRVKPFLHEGAGEAGERGGGCLQRGHGAGEAGGGAGRGDIEESRGSDGFVGGRGVGEAFADGDDDAAEGEIEEGFGVEPAGEFRERSTGMGGPGANEIDDIGGGEAFEDFDEPIDGVAFAEESADDFAGVRPMVRIREGSTFWRETGPPGVTASSMRFSQMLIQRPSAMACIQSGRGMSQMRILR
jgi:hypothetical protein